jgi:hypothetical protein
MRKLYRPRNELELTLIKSIFDGENIPYFVHNDNFGSLQIGPQIDLFNAKMIMVDEACYDRAKDLITDFLNNMDESTEPAKEAYSLGDKIRMVLEAAVFGWFIPGKKKRKPKEQ